MPSAALSALLVRVRHPVPRCAFTYKSDCGSSFPIRKKKTRRVSPIHAIASIKKPMTFLLQSVIIF